SRSPSHHPLFQAAFFLQNAPALSGELPGLKLTPVPVDIGAAHFELTLFVRDTENGSVASLEYNTNLFDALTVVKMLEHFNDILDEIVQNPDAVLINISLHGEKLPTGSSAVRVQDEIEEFNFQL